MNQFLPTRNMDSTRIDIPLLQFNLDTHQQAILKAFNDFIERLYNFVPMCNIQSCLGTL